jgi:hypothetical protein
MIAYLIKSVLKDQNIIFASSENIDSTLGINK